MNKPPYQPTALQMQAQAHAALTAQQQAYLQMQQRQATLNPIQGGTQNGGHRYTSTTTSSGTLGPAYLAYVGASGTAVYSTLWSCAESAQPSPAIEEAGIRAGEITGYRAWYLRSGDLWSMYALYVWQPGVQKITEECLNRHMGNGFHAFKDMDHCRREYPGPGIVLGEVALWGEVYEHERGYRAECARVTRIISVSDYEPPWYKFWQPSVLTQLRRKYGVEE